MIHTAGYKRRRRCNAGLHRGVTIAACTASVLDSENAADKAVLDQLRDDPVIEFVDHRDTQLAELRGLLPPPGPELAAEPCRWAYYPWRRAVVAGLRPRGFSAGGRGGPPH